MDKLILRFGLISGVIFTLLIFVSSYAEEAPASVNTNQLPQIIQSPSINKQFDWAGELMPLTADAKERLDAQLLRNSYYHSSTIQYLKRANRYFPTIERILLEQGIPDDFKYLAVAESGLEHATSPANAKGFWQFRKLAAKEQGLEVNDEVDERYHVEKSTLAACNYLKWLKRKFGTWTNASAAYNVGPTAFSRQIKAQKETNYYDMNLNKETSKYVFRLIAIKEIMSNPQEFGFYLQPEEKYLPMTEYYEVEVSESVTNWGDFAHEHGTTYREIKRYNPWLRDNHLTVIKNKYTVRIPRV